MTGYSFQEGIPEGFSPDFEIGIFHDPQHLKLQSLSGWRTFVALNSEQRLIVALIHIHVAGSHASSPFRSPYGSFVFSQGTSDELLKGFISFVEGELKNSDVQKLVLKNPPEVYRDWTSIEKIFIASGYHIKSEETSSVIPVTDKSFSEKLHRTKKSRLKKGAEGELTFERLLPTQFDKMYAFIMTCRERKGYSLSMSADDLKKVMEVFPESFYLHVLSLSNKWVAASISIRVEHNILYTFYYDHDAEYDRLSPVVMLMYGIYSFCQQDGIKLLDLGTSNINGKLSESLLDFKLSLGAEPSRKLTFVKHFS